MPWKLFIPEHGADRKFDPLSLSRPVIEALNFRTVLPIILSGTKLSTRAHYLSYNTVDRHALHGSTNRQTNG
jgi:hypothetical protein